MMVPTKASTAASASQRASTTSRPDDSEAELLGVMGGDCVPLGSIRNAKIPLVTCPSTAEVTW
jgi:hypothetical protein